MLHSSLCNFAHLTSKMILLNVFQFFVYKKSINISQCDVFYSQWGWNQSGQGVIWAAMFKCTNKCKFYKLNCLLKSKYKQIRRIPYQKRTTEIKKTLLTNVIVGSLRDLENLVSLYLRKIKFIRISPAPQIFDMIFRIGYFFHHISNIENCCCFQF